MNELDRYSPAYSPNSPSTLECDLILHWYPRRIVERFGHCDSLLELGIGHGFTASLFNGACDRHVIVEGSDVMIRQFQENNPSFGAELIKDWFESYKTDEQFDVIVMGFILEHVEDPGFLLDRYREKLNPGGRMFIAVPNAKSLNRRLGLELGKIDDIYSLNENDIAQGHRRQFCLESLHTLVTGCGWRVIHQEGIYLKPLPLAALKDLPDFQENLQAMLRVGVDFPDLCVVLLMEVALE